jgi:hypothetical protein
MVESAEIKVKYVITISTWNTANPNSVFKGVIHTLSKMHQVVTFVTCIQKTPTFILYLRNLVFWQVQYIYINYQSGFQILFKHEYFMREHIHIIISKAFLYPC